MDALIKKITDINAIIGIFINLSSYPSYTIISIVIVLLIYFINYLDK